MPAAGVDGSATGELTGWFVRHRSEGTILSIGASEWLPAGGDGDHVVVTVDHLASTLDYEAVFDHAWLGVGPSTGELPDLLTRVHRAVKPGGTALLALPFGLARNGTGGDEAFYMSSVRRLVEPLFDVLRVDLVGEHIGVVARRLDQATGRPVLALDEAEQAFVRQERRLRETAQQLTTDLVASGARYRGAVGRIDGLQRDLNRVKSELASLRRKVAPLKRSLALPLAILRGQRRLRKAVRTRLAGAPAPAPPSAAVPTPRTGAHDADVAEPTWRDAFRLRFDDWLRTARAAPGDEVVVMFSGTTFVQEHRGNRPIRLTNVYLARRCPVFFNYYRWNSDDPLPDHPDELLFQSPIDLTPALLDALLTADFGPKRKLFFASFPHELMVRYLTLAAQLGWATIYDARDDWEEFAKVGMAKWYHPGYERYVASHADIVTAVSRPLARKMSALAGGRLVQVNANALDVRFPRPTRPRRTRGAPVIGYFGHLTDKWFDWPLVIAAARRYPKFTFELAGHQQPKLDLPPNVKLLGLLGHQDLAERSTTWSLSLIPFKNSPLADAVDPIKIYEYLHLRLPVLTTYFPQCRDYPGTAITEGNDEFLQRLPQLVDTKLDEDEVSAWLAENTWERRIDTYSGLAAAVLQSGRTGSLSLLGGR